MQTAMPMPTALYDPDDTSAYVQIGAVSGETGRSALTIYQQTSGYTEYRPRLRLKSYGTTAFTIEGIVKPTGTDVEGTTALSVTHGTSQLALSQTLDMAKLISSSKGLGVKSSGPYYQPDTAVATYNDLWHEGNANFAIGTGTSSSTAGGDTSVSFGKTFASAPVVCANTTGANSYTCRIKSVSTTGFVLVVSGASIGFNYIAALA